MATIISIKDGLWSDVTVWGGVAPVAADTVTVRHKVTMDLNDQNSNVIFGRINVESNATSYSTGFAMQTGTTAIGTSTVWVVGHVGSYIVYDDGFVTKITGFISTTNITVENTRTMNRNMNYYITSYYGQLIHGDGETCINCSMWLYVNGGKYEMKANSTAKFKSTSKTLGTEGGVVGINYNGDAKGSNLKIIGSTPMPEAHLIQNIFLGDYVLPVDDASQFVAGDYIAVYYPMEDTTNSYYGWSGVNQSDEGFVVQYVSGNNIYIRQRVAREGSITSYLPVGQNFAVINNARKWQPLMKLWIDNEIFTIESLNEETNTLTFTTNSTIAHSSGALVYETGCQKDINDIISTNAPIGQSYIAVTNTGQWSVGEVVNINNTETKTITTVDLYNNRLYFSANLTLFHGAYEFISKNLSVRESHRIGDHVYKIATTLASPQLINSASITVTSISGFEIGDRILIEGNARYYGKQTQAVIANIVGNIITLSTPLVTAAEIGFLVTKLNRDCVITCTSLGLLTQPLTIGTKIAYFNNVSQFLVSAVVLINGEYLTVSAIDIPNLKVTFSTNAIANHMIGSDAKADINRCCVYVVGGAATCRQMVIRNVEVSHAANSYTTYVYKGFYIQGSYSRNAMEREIRGVSLWDCYNTSYCSIFLYNGGYINGRNCVTTDVNDGVRMYDHYGSGLYNNLAIGSRSYSLRYGATYYYNQFQYNIGMNSVYGIYYDADNTAIFPNWHNIFKHHERGLFFPQACVSAQYGTWVKNRYEDIYYRHGYIDGTRIMIQEIDFRLDKNPGYTMANWASSYANYDERGMNGGMLIIINKDFIRGNFEMHSAGGIIEKDEIKHMGNGWSYKYFPSNSTIELRISQMVYVKYGVPVKVIAYMMKDSTYNGGFRPRIIAQGRALQYTFIEMQNINDKWVKVELNFTPTRSEMIEIGVGGRGSAGIFWIDPRVSVTTHDISLIQGPYSTNLMFGLEPIYDDNAGIILGGVTI